MFKLDEIDKKIINLLQKNANIPLTEISKRVGISSTPCWNRIRKLEEEGIILSKFTEINQEKINLPISIFVSLSINSHSDKWLTNFINVINKYDQITEVYRLTGSSSDYLLKVIAPSIKQYDELQQKLINELEFNNISSGIVLKVIKKNNYIPLDFV
ncbi:MAG: Leucine-responsive regulatory protein [Alphaproteobacteria bacterium MarineAlpha5_Bin9]|nr:MAG: Leucine-responsive regulatory protein [Alphaproteobacteria bacterium MarineAlpha5_Bin9]|tara:strand:- start:6458 stop:6928 length:471 start_codon:yes stop_codon:yes gene_type:complete